MPFTPVIPCISPRVRCRAHATARRPKWDWPIRASGPKWEAARCQVLESDAARLRILRQLWAEQAKRCALRLQRIRRAVLQRIRRRCNAAYTSARVIRKNKRGNPSCRAGRGGGAGGGVRAWSEWSSIACARCVLQRCARLQHCNVVRSGTGRTCPCSRPTRASRTCRAG